MSADNDDYGRADAKPTAQKKAPTKTVQDLPAGTNVSTIVDTFEAQESDMPHLPPIERILRASGMKAQYLRDTAETIRSLIGKAPDAPRAEHQKMVETAMGEYAGTIPNAPLAIAKLALEQVRKKAKK